ncbi:MAG: hypothetical protein ACD_74C00136G0001 [uncultured bacterium]|nr:MAG: hypothetical protein ACD_74C00136G0001 [uncultured bacterium]
MIGSGLHGPDRVVDRGIAGHQDNLGRRGQSYDPLENVKAVGIVEANVRDQNLRGYFRKPLHGLGSGDKAFDLIAILAQGLHQPADRDYFIVKDIDADFLRNVFCHEPGFSKKVAEADLRISNNRGLARLARSPSPCKANFTRGEWRTAFTETEKNTLAFSKSWRIFMVSSPSQHP